MIVQALLSITLSGYYGPFGALIAELFPAHIRSTGLSLAYNLAVMLFGGFGPFIVTWLIRTTDSQLAPTFYVMGGACAVSDRGGLHSGDASRRMSTRRAN